MWMVHNLSIQGLVGRGVISAFLPSQPSLRRLPPTKMVIVSGGWRAGSAGRGACCQPE